MLLKILQKFAFAAVIGSFACAAPVYAAQTAESVGKLAVAVQGAWARPMLPAAQVGAGYFEMRNSGNKAERLIAVESAVAEKVEIHAMSMEGNTMKMRHLKDGIEIAAKSSLFFKPGSYHLMFISPKKPFVAGQSFQTRFKFAGGSTLEVPFTVRESGKAEAGKTAHHG